MLRIRTRWLLCVIHDPCLLIGKGEGELSLVLRIENEMAALFDSMILVCCTRAPQGPRRNCVQGARLILSCALLGQSDERVSKATRTAS